MVTEKAEDTYSYCCKCSSGKIKREEVLAFIMSMYYFRKMRRVRGIYFQ